MVNLHRKRAGANQVGLKNVLTGVLLRRRGGISFLSVNYLFFMLLLLIMIRCFWICSTSLFQGKFLDFGLKIPG